MCMGGQIDGQARMQITLSQCGGLIKQILALPRGQSHIDSSQALRHMVNLSDAKKLNSKYQFLEE